MQGQIVDQLAALVQQEVANLGGDLGALEQAVFETVMSLGQGVLQRLIDHGDKGYEGSSKVCPCDHSQRFVGYRGKDIHSLFGWVRVNRAYYHCAACGAHSVPYDRRRGLGGEQISPALAQFCCTVAVDDSFEESSRKVQCLLGQQVSERTIERLVHHVGGVILQHKQQDLQQYFKDHRLPRSAGSVQRLYIAADGTTVHEDDGWHEAKVGCVSWQNDRFERVSRYVGGFYGSERFGWDLWLAACGCGLPQASEVIYLGDGAAWIRTEHYRHFGRATFIIDWYHASEHVWDCGKRLFGEGTEAAGQWVREILDLLWAGKIGPLLSSLDQQIKLFRGGRREAVKALHRYVSRNGDNMRYDVYRQKGYEIGSGVVEGACKHVVGKRLKQSGMKWSRAGSSATLALRMAWLNDQWDRLWTGKPLAA